MCYKIKSLRLIENVEVQFFLLFGFGVLVQAGVFVIQVVLAHRSMTVLIHTCMLLANFHFHKRFPC